MSTTRKLLGGLLGCVLTLAVAGPASAHPRHTRHQLHQARHATAQYRNIALALGDGFALPTEGPLSQCVERIDGPGAMGYHFINGDNAADTVLDPSKPEALVYAPGRHGRLRLAAVEYVVFADAWQAAHPGTTPRLFGHKLFFQGEGNQFGLPPFWEIHAWIWQHNPDGRFANFSRRVHCANAQPGA